jgi:hypothetical protein
MTVLHDIFLMWKITYNNVYMWVIQEVEVISFHYRKESGMYVTAILFFNTVSLQFHTLFVAVHKLPDSITEEGFGLPETLMHHSFHFFITAKPRTT